MEILYGIGMVAVFILCLVLLSTARRILRSSPLSNSSFGATRMYAAERAEDESQEELSSAQVMDPIDEIENFASIPVVVDDPLAREVLEEAAAENMVSEPAMAESFSPMPPAWTAAPVEPKRGWAGKFARFPRPTRRAYGYAFECLLIGISAWALVKTQRSTQKYKALPASTSRGRVA